MSTVAGVRHRLPNADYHAGPGLSHSGIKRLLRSPWHYHALTLPHGAPPKEPTAQMFAGTLAHCATLEPGEFAKRYPVGPEVSSKASREWKNFAAELGPGREPITPMQDATAWAQAASLRAHPIVAELLSKGEPEASVYWHDPAHHILCKARPDWMHPCGTLEAPRIILLDVKTAADASAEGFARAVANFGYHTQADWYCLGVEIATGVRCEGMVFAVVESEFPYACAAYMLDDESMAIARERNRRALATYAACEAKSTWPGYPTDLQVITLPRWELTRAYAEAA